MMVFVLMQEGVTDPQGVFDTLEKAKSALTDVGVWQYSKVQDQDEPEQWSCGNLTVLMFRVD